MESEEIRERHRKSEEEWGISDPPAIQQIIVKVGKRRVCHVDLDGLEVDRKCKNGHRAARAKVVDSGVA